MRNGLIGVGGALMFASTMAFMGCSSDSDSGETAGGGSSSTAPVSASGCTMSAGGTEVTSLCGASPLNTLTQAETLQLCSDTGAYVSGSISRATACKYAGLVAAASSSSPMESELQGACTMRETACNQDDSIMGPGENTLCGQIPPTCTATVAQYSTCVVDEAVLFDQGASALVSCSMLTFAAVNTAFDVPMAATAAPSCAALKTACPNFSLPYIN